MGGFGPPPPPPPDPYPPPPDFRDNDPALQATAFQPSPADLAPPRPPPPPPPPDLPPATEAYSGQNMPPAPSALPSGGPPRPAPPPPGRQRAASAPAVDSGAGPRRVLAGFLVSFQEDNYGAHWVLHEGENLVGRAETSVRCDVPIAHGTTSTRHATLRCRDGMISVADMQSTNGTYVNGRRLGPGEEVPVQEGDKIRFGGYTAHVMVARRQ